MVPGGLGEDLHSRWRRDAGVETDFQKAKSWEVVIADEVEGSLLLELDRHEPKVVVEDLLGLDSLVGLPPAGSVLITEVDDDVWDVVDVGREEALLPLERLVPDTLTMGPLNIFGAQVIRPNLNMKHTHLPIPDLLVEIGIRKLGPL